MFHQQQGFNLVELLVVTGIVAILLAAGAPTFSTLSKQQRLTSASNSLLAAIQHARSESLVRSSNVVLCPTVTGQQCADTGAWHLGYISFTDVNDNRRVDRTEPILRHGAALPAGVSAWSSRGRRLLRFKASGFAPGTNMTIRLCSHRQSEGRNLVVSNSGRARIQSADCS